MRKSQESANKRKNNQSIHHYCISQCNAVPMEPCFFLRIKKKTEIFYLTVWNINLQETKKSPNYEIKIKITVARKEGNCTFLSYNSKYKLTILRRKIRYVRYKLATVKKNKQKKHPNCEIKKKSFFFWGETKNWIPRYKVRIHAKKVRILSQNSVFINCEMDTESWENCQKSEIKFQNCEYNWEFCLIKSTF